MMATLLKNFIGGNFEEVSGGDRVEVLNPARDTVISEIPDSSAETVDQAVQVSKGAQKAWAKSPPIQRAMHLRKIAARGCDRGVGLCTAVRLTRGKEHQAITSGYWTPVLIRWPTRRSQPSQAILARDRGRCVYCRKRLNKSALKIDHLIPVALGGDGHISNLAASCLECNTEKGDLLPLDFIDQRVARQLGQDGAPLPEGQARRVWRVLVALAGASWDARQDFIGRLARGCREYHFDSSLGFQGTFWNSEGRWYVTCSEEDKTAERLATMRKINRLFWKMRME
jgi:5-methylcytosine-specific restriction endonuclease McrA